MTICMLAPAFSSPSPPVSQTPHSLEGWESFPLQYPACMPLGFLQLGLQQCHLIRPLDLDPTSHGESLSIPNIKPSLVHLSQTLGHKVGQTKI